MKSFFFAVILAATASLSGCAPVLIAGGVTTGAMVATDRRSTGTIVDDEGIELQARKALDDDPQLRNETHISVTSFNFVVLLTGQAPTEELRRRAESIVRSIPGVRLVYNEIELAAPASVAVRSNDTLITGKVKTELLTGGQMNANHIKVVTENGTVYLMGLVTHEEADRASEVASTTGGVAKVVRLFEYLD
jgi:osmotically-inducible protein OsmY